MPTGSISYYKGRINALKKRINKMKDKIEEGSKIFQAYGSDKRSQVKIEIVEDSSREQLLKIDAYHNCVHTTSIYLPVTALTAVLSGMTEGTINRALKFYPSTYPSSMVGAIRDIKKEKHNRENVWHF